MIFKRDSKADVNVRCEYESRGSDMAVFTGISLTMHLLTSWKVSFQVFSAYFKRRSEIMDFITNSTHKKKRKKKDKI